MAPATTKRLLNNGAVMLRRAYRHTSCTKRKPLTDPNHIASDYVQVIFGLHLYRFWHDEQPFLRSLRHTPYVVGEAQVDICLPAINYGGIANVWRVYRLLLDKQTKNEMAAMHETTLWYGAACVAFLDETLFFTALLRMCPECQNFAIQKEQSPLMMLAPTAPPVTVAIAPTVNHITNDRNRSNGQRQLKRPPSIANRFAIGRTDCKREFLIFNGSSKQHGEEHHTP